jgi:hypothetical protein
LTITDESVSIHLSSYVCQTGATSFVLPSALVDGEGWKFSKNETLVSPEDYYAFDYILTEDEVFHTDGFVKIKGLECFDGLRLREVKKLLKKETGEGMWDKVKGLVGKRECVSIMKRRVHE